jgi:hypothetical protein
MYWDGQGWGAPQVTTTTKRANGGKVALIVVAIVIALFAMGKCGSSDTKSSSSSSSSSRTSSRALAATAPAEPATPTAAAAGSAARVRNIGDEPQGYFGDNQKLIDASGREYGASSAADLWMNVDNVTGDINPGNSIQVSAAFDVPPGTAPTELEVHDSMFSGGARIGL